ncbi:MAG: OmpH family outer membrane protein [Veillonellaceae bacterium]|jgi:outer membrane protein|nr:OmpH family outer membrane protein [Veillonellaceae bacterium]
MKNTGKLVVLLLVVFAFSVLVSGCSGTGGQNIGVLDVNKVMAESPKVKGFQEQLNAKGKELTDNLEKEKAGLSAEEYQKRQEAAYSEFVKIKQDLEGQIDASIKQTLEQVAQEKKLSVVLYKNGVAQGGTDITDEVIKRMQ